MHQGKNTVRVFVFQSALLWACVPLLIGFLPVYLNGSGFRSDQIGIIMALNPLMSIILQPFIGVYVDRSRSKNLVLILLTLGSVVSILLFPISRAYIYVLAVGAMLAVFQAALTPISETITLESLDSIGRSYGPVRLAGTISYAVVSILAGFLMRLDIKSIFYITAVIGVLNIFSAWRLPRVKGHQADSKKVSFRELFQDKLLAVFLPFLVIAQFAIGLYLSFFPIYFASIGGTQSAIGVIYFIAAMSELPFLLNADKIIRKLSIELALILSMGVIALRFLLFFLVKSPVAMYPVALLNGFTFIVFAFSLAVYVNRTVRKELRATGQTILGVATAIGRLLGSLIGGFIVQGFGVRNTMLYSFLLCLASTLCFIALIIVVRKKRAQPKLKLI